MDDHETLMNSNSPWPSAHGHAQGHGTAFEDEAPHPLSDGPSVSRVGSMVSMVLYVLDTWCSLSLASRLVVVVRPNYGQGT